MRVVSMVTSSCSFDFSMAPKKAKSKKGKLTKAQKAKLREEEEQRRLQEEEEARIQAELEEQERLEKERQHQELLERLEQKDRERRESELSEVRRLLEENKIAVSEWSAETTSKTKWCRYTCCDGTPDPTVQREVNTYISLWRDDPEVRIMPVLKECCIAVRLAEELGDLLRDATDVQEAQTYQEALHILQDLIHDKHRITTEEILKRAVENIDIETGNMQMVVKDDNVTLCLWANLQKNQRFKGYYFKEVSLGFELPKHLAMRDIAVRILYTGYDHLSPLAKMAHMKLHPSNNKFLVGIDADPLKQKETKDEGMEKKEEGVPQQKVDEEVPTEMTEEPKSSRTSKKTNSRSTRASESQVQTQMGALSSVAELSAASKDVEKQEQAVDMMEYMPLGGVFYYDVFLLPPQSQRVSDWKIRQVLDTGLQEFQGQVDMPKLDGNKVGVSVRVPDNIVLLETPKVALWHAEKQEWRMGGISDLSYQEEESKLSFKMDSFQTFVLMQEIYLNLPFQSWELRPQAQDSAVFTVNGALLEFIITINDNQCMLKSDRERGLTHLLGKWMSFPALKSAMLTAGVNIFVNEYTEKYVSTYGKDPLTEHAAYEQMSLYASACAYSWSKWNAECGTEHLVMQVCEHLGPRSVPRKSWQVYLVGAQRSQKLEISETSEAFSTDHYPGSDFHSTFIHTLQDNMSTEGINRVRESSQLFVDTVLNLLCNTRPLMHT